jgi:hypothetical protein
MAFTTPSTWVAGAILTAAQLNQQLRDNMIATPRGVLGKQTLTTSFATSATHTTMQDTGQTLSITYEANRILRLTCQGHYYPNGGLQSIDIEFAWGATPTAIGRAAMNAVALETTGAQTFTTVMYVAPGATAGTANFKVRMRAASANTQVTQYADATLPRFFIVEDIGAA